MDTSFAIPLVNPDSRHEFLFSKRMGQAPQLCTCNDVQRRTRSRDELFQHETHTLLKLAYSRHRSMPVHGMICNIRGRRQGLEETHDAALTTNKSGTVAVCRDTTSEGRASMSLFGCNWFKRAAVGSPSPRNLVRRRTKSVKKSEFEWKSA